MAISLFNIQEGTVPNFPFILLFILFTAVIAKILQRIVTKLTSTVREIPSPPGHFLLGHLPGLMRSEVADVYTEWMSFAKNGMVRVNLLYGPEKILVTRPEDVKKVLLTRNAKFCRQPIVKQAIPALIGGVFASEGNDHAWQRKLLHPSFSSTSVKQFADLFLHQASLLVKLWTQKIHDEKGTFCTLIVENDIGKLVVDITSNAVFGYDTKTLSGTTNEITKALQTVIEGSFNFKAFVLNQYFGFLGPWAKLFGVEDVSSANRIVEEFILKIIARKEEKLKSQSDTDVCGRSRPDLLELMMKEVDTDTGTKLNRNILKRNVMTFMVAGFDTTKSSMTWTLYLLALNRDKQEKAREEVLSASPRNSDITVESIGRMPYVTCVLKESLRLYGPGCVFGRHTLEPVELGGILIPKGYEVQVPMCYIHRLEEYWTKPLEFRPERFDIDENLDNDKKDLGFRFLPFSMGPRGCIGDKFAMLELRIVLASLLKNFRFSISPNHPKVGSEMALSLRPVPSPELQVELV